MFREQYPRIGRQTRGPSNIPFVSAHPNHYIVVERSHCGHTKWRIMSPRQRDTSPLNSQCCCPPTGAAQHKNARLQPGRWPRSVPTYSHRTIGRRISQAQHTSEVPCGNIIVMAGQASYAALIGSVVLTGSYIPCPKITFLIDRPDDLGCEICQVSKLQFRTSDHGFPDSTPAILPCGHIAGHRCLQEWLRRNHNCPFCRLNLEYELCDHTVQARPVNPANIHSLPRTLPEGGRIAAQCADCRVQTSMSCANVMWAANAERFREARDQYLRTRAVEDLARVWAMKVRIESAYSASFAETTVKGQAVEW